MAAPKVAKIPSLIYGTAWKKEKTRELVKQAILSGFRGVDTAAQPKHYQEDLVGQGIRDALQEDNIRREDLYIQTKFTAVHGQDPNNLPYDPSASIADQVAASVPSSLHNLRHSDNEISTQAQQYIDCLVLHSPYTTIAETKQAWQAMESHVPHHVLTLGISNVYHPRLLQAIYDFATIKPSVVQNRFYADTKYDYDIRAFCAEKGMKYQSFWTLTANPELVLSDVVKEVAEKMKVSHAVVLYALVLALGDVSVLNGTTDVERMRADLDGVVRVQAWAERNSDVWDDVKERFRILLQNS